MLSSLRRFGSARCTQARVKVAEVTVAEVTVAEEEEEGWVVDKKEDGEDGSKQAAMICAVRCFSPLSLPIS